MLKLVLKYGYFFFWGVLCACSALEDGSQFINKATAPSFVSELYSNVTQQVSINHTSESHITWMGFIQSNDYDYFKITKVQVGSTTIVADGMDVNGATYTANPNSIVKDVTVNASTQASNEYANGSISVAGSGDLKITVTYSPLQAIASENEPHEAYLIIYYDAPSVGAQRIKLQGYTQGVKNEKCARAASTMTPFVYAFKGNAFNFYFCGEEVQSTGQNNIAGLDPSDPGYHGQTTNLTVIPTLDASNQEQYLTFYQVDEETVCLLSSDLTDGAASIPDFTFLIPEGLAPIDQLDITMAEGSFAECLLDGATIFCDASVLIDTGVVPVSALTATNGVFAEEDLVTSQCSDFGTLSGSGDFGSDELTLVMKGTMLSDSNTQSYNIVDALVAAEIDLECASGC